MTILRIRFPLAAFAISLLASFELCVFGQDTLTSLTAGRAPQTFEELWSDFDPRLEPLDEEILHEWEEEGVNMRVLRYRVGKFKGQKSMIAAIYGAPAGRQKLPGLVQIHGGGQYADYRAVLTNAKRGYATISIAWAGRISAPDYRVTPSEVKLFWNQQSEDPNYRVTTDWGALDGYHAPSRHAENIFPKIPSPAPWTLDEIESPRNNSWFLCTLAARRALTFLERQPEVDGSRLGVYGHSMGGKLTVMTAGSDERVKAAAPSCGGVSDRDNASNLFKATLGDVPYLKRIHCPIAFLSPANDFHGRIHDLQAALSEIKSTDWRVICSPHHNHQDNAAFEVATQLWFDQHLKQDFKWPSTPKSSLKLRTNHQRPDLFVLPSLSLPILSVEVYYTQDADPETDHEGVINRFWHHAKTERIKDTWKASLSLSSTNQPLWAYANINYKLAEPITGAGYYYRVYTADTFTLSTPLLTATATELQSAEVEPSLVKTNQIENFEDDWEQSWFTYRPGEWPRRTHKVNDPTWAAPKGAHLSITLRSKENNHLVIGIDDCASILPLDASESWQTYSLSPKQFTDARGDDLSSFDHIMELRLSAQETLRQRRPEATRKVGKPWSGPAPEFRELRWVTPSHDQQ